MGILKASARKIASNIGEFAAMTHFSPVEKDVRGIRMQLDLTQSIDAKLFFSSSHEKLTLDIMEYAIKDGYNIIDVGANIGYFTLKMSNLTGPDGHVIAFEPSNWTYRKLCKNIEINDFTNIDAVHGGVGRQSLEDVKMTLPCGYRLDGKDTATSQRVNIWSIDDYTKGKQIDFIKIDTDGWETEVFAGARNTLARWKPQIIFELAPDHCRRAGHDPMQMFEQLKELGYNFTDERLAPIEPAQAIAGVPRFGSINIFAKTQHGI